MEEVIFEFCFKRGFFGGFWVGEDVVVLGSDIVLGCIAFVLRIRVV